MRAIILRYLVGAGVILAFGSAKANPIDDCNQNPDAAKQIDGCTEFLTLEPESPYVALAYGLRGGAYEGDLNRAVANFNHAIEIDPPLVSRTFGVSYK